MTASDSPISVDYAAAEASSSIFPLPPKISSHRSSWQNIQLAHYFQPAWETPELAADQYTIVLSNWKKSTEVTLTADGKLHRLLCNEDRVGCVEIMPANMPMKSSWTQAVEFTHLYIEPSFLSRIAHESIDPDRVEFPLLLQQPSPLLWSMGAAMRSILTTDEKNSRFYAESMATAIAAHLLTHYATQKHILREYNGLPTAKLKQAIEYINERLGEDLSLTDMATCLGMSQYHFSRLFKQSMGMTAHTYLVEQRVKRAQQLLSQTELSILDIANECGFANPSHFARCFRQQRGMSPTQFRAMR
jgi:AraC family transcriptional regulator